MALLKEAGDDNTAHATLIDTARAVALCLEQIEKASVIREMTTAAKEAIAEARTEAMEMMQAMAEKTEKGWKEAQGKLEASIKRSAEAAREDMRRPNNGGHIEHREGSAPERSQDFDNHRPTYAQAASQARALGEPREGVRLPFIPGNNRSARAVEDVKVRESKRGKQILVDGIEGVMNATEGLTNMELVEKANLAWKALPQSRARDEFDDPTESDGEGEDGSVSKPEGVKFVTALKLKNGGVVFDCNLESGTDWLRHRVTKQEFESKFGGSAVIKRRAFTMMIGYLPVRLKDCLEGMGVEIERENGEDVKFGSVKKLRWMRNPNVSWGQHQKLAHAMITVDDKTTANNLIRNGIVIQGERRWVKKMEDEPKRCYRCQLIDPAPGHRAATCERAEICANCGSTEHQTGKCETAVSKFRCASCTLGKRKANGHASWDRRCPIYIEKQLALRDKIPENHFFYYPDESELWTWEQKHDTAIESTRDNDYTPSHQSAPEQAWPTFDSLLPKISKKRKGKRREEEQRTEEDEEREMAALMEMAEKLTDDEDDRREEGEVSIRRGGSTDWATDQVDKAWEKLMGENNTRSESRASTRNTVQTVIPPTWSQHAGGSNGNTSRQRPKQPVRK